MALGASKLAPLVTPTSLPSLFHRPTRLSGSRQIPETLSLQSNSSLRGLRDLNAVTPAYGFTHPYVHSMRETQAREQHPMPQFLGSADFRLSIVLILHALSSGSFSTTIVRSLVTCILSVRFCVISALPDSWKRLYVDRVLVTSGSYMSQRYGSPIRSQEEGPKKKCTQDYAGFNKEDEELYLW